MRLRVSDLLSPGGVKRRVVILQQKTGRPVQFDVTDQTGRQLLLGHTKLESTVRHLGVEVDDPLELSEALGL